MLRWKLQYNTWTNLIVTTVDSLLSKFLDHDIASLKKKGEPVGHLLIEQFVKTVAAGEYPDQELLQHIARGFEQLDLLGNAEKEIGPKFKEAFGIPKSKHRQKSNRDTLTPTQTDIINLKCENENLTNAAIAEKQNLSENTVQKTLSEKSLQLKIARALRDEKKSYEVWSRQVFTQVQKIVVAMRSSESENNRLTLNLEGKQYQCYRPSKELLKKLEQQLEKASKDLPCNNVETLTNSFVPLMLAISYKEHRDLDNFLENLPFNTYLPILTALERAVKNQP